MKDSRIFHKEREIGEHARVLRSINSKLPYAQKLRSRIALLNAEIKAIETAQMAKVV